MAEVLITLGIIGVVAAMTMPTLIGNYQKQQTVAQLKKAYSELFQAVKLSEGQYGPMEDWDFSDFETSDERRNYFVENYLFPNLKILKKCEPDESGCWAEDAKSLDGISLFYSSVTPAPTFVTTSGYSVYYWLHAVGNGAWFWVDINGPKKPNIAGKDIFPFLMSWGNANTVPPSSAAVVCTSKLGLFPLGLQCNNFSPTRYDLINGNIEDTNASRRVCKKGDNTNASGSYCGALMMMDGWQIAPDYPW